MATSTRRTLLTLVRVTISIGLIAFLLSQIDLSALLLAWREAILPLVIAAFLLYAAGMIVNAWKWWLLLRASGDAVAFGWTIRATFIGQFFSNFLPTMIGGDAMRVYMLQQQIGRMSISIASVVVSRVTGFLALTLIALSALLVSVPVLAPMPGLLWSVAACIALAGVGVAVVFGAPSLVGWAVRLPVPNLLNWRGRLDAMATALGTYYSYRRTMITTMMLSFVYQVSLIVVTYAGIRALRMPVSFGYAALIGPISDIVGLVPLFVNNLGAREGTFVVLLGQLGIPTAQALALSFLMFMVRMLVSLIGGAFYLLAGIPVAHGVSDDSASATRRSSNSSDPNRI